jgi:peptide-methionine (S)-S-oxide reductase
VIFYRSAEEKRIAEASKGVVQAHFKRPVATTIQQAGPFWRAEEYHQDYAKKNPVRYKFYRHNCGRDARLRELWGEPH